MLIVQPVGVEWQRPSLPKLEGAEFTAIVGFYLWAITLRNRIIVGIEGFEPPQPKHQIYSLTQLSHVGAYPFK